MRNRGCFLVLLLSLVGEASAVSTQTPPLQVQVYDYCGLSPAALHEFIARIREILSGSGVSLEVMDCKSIEATCKSHSGGPRQIVVRVIAGTVRKTRDVNPESLGLSVADSNGGTYASVFVQPIKDTAAEANLPWVIVLAYAAAHEIGHLLLGKGTHTAKGVMKPYWNTDDLWSMAQNRLHFSLEQARELASRYGAPHLAEGNSPPTNFR
jgi:hypothetical protein